MSNRVVIFALFLCICSSCSNEEKRIPNSAFQTIAGRDEGSSLERKELYRVKPPSTWKRLDPPPDVSIQDTTKSLCEYTIESADGKIRIAIHNFPSHIADDRIPPTAQAARWKNQFDRLDPAEQVLIPQSFSGFFGLLYEGRGLSNNEETAVMGWVLQIGPEHYRTLSRPQFPFQMRADITIKATGPASMISKHRKEIMAFARSFELIEEIPSG